VGLPGALAMTLDRDENSEKPARTPRLALDAKRAARHRTARSLGLVLVCLPGRRMCAPVGAFVSFAGNCGDPVCDLEEAAAVGVDGVDVSLECRGAEEAKDDLLAVGRPTRLEAVVEVRV
jgi:hypothetical protein